MNDDNVVRWAALDAYDYDLDQLDSNRYVIVIPVDSEVDPTISDIASEITSNDDHVYVEGFYFDLIKIQVTKDPFQRPTHKREVRILVKLHTEEKINDRIQQC